MLSSHTEILESSGMYLPCVIVLANIVVNIPISDSIFFYVLVHDTNLVRIMKAMIGKMGICLILS